MFIFFEKSVVNLNEVCKTGLLYILYFFSRHFSLLKGDKTTQFAVHLEFAAQRSSRQQLDLYQKVLVWL